MHGPNEQLGTLAEGLTLDSASAPDIVGMEVAEETYVDGHIAMVSDDDAFRVLKKTALVLELWMVTLPQDGGHTGTQRETSARSATSTVPRRRAEANVGSKSGAHLIQVAGVCKHFGTMRGTKQTMVRDASHRSKVALQAFYPLAHRAFCNQDIEMKTRTILVSSLSLFRLYYGCCSRSSPSEPATRTIHRTAANAQMLRSWVAI